MGLCICAKGFIQVRASSFIFVIYMRWAFKLTFHHHRHRLDMTLAVAEALSPNKLKLEIAQSEQDVSPFCKESDMTYS